MATKEEEEEEARQQSEEEEATGTKHPNQTREPSFFKDASRQQQPNSTECETASSSDQQGIGEVRATNFQQTRLHWDLCYLSQEKMGWSTVCGQDNREHRHQIPETLDNRCTAAQRNR